MRRIILLLSLFLALLATACGGGGGDAVPTAAPTAPPESLGAESEEGASPRVDAATSIPPTWTPQAPAAVQATPAPAAAGAVSAEEGDIYVVQAGDTLAEIAIQFGVDLNALAEVNGIQNIDHIEVGQELLIPQQ